jgi:hypothetical protein
MADLRMYAGKQAGRDTSVSPGHLAPEQPRPTAGTANAGYLSVPAANQHIMNG